MSNVDRVSGSFDDVLPSSMLPNDPLMVILKEGATQALHQWAGAESSQVQTQVSIKVSAKTTQLVFTFASYDKLPPGFTMDGQSVAPNSDGTGSITLTVAAGSTELKRTITWDVAPDGSTVDPAAYRTQVTLTQTAEGGASTQIEQTFTLGYEVITSSSQYAEKDANGLTIIKMAANGYSYSVTGRETNDTLNAGNGDDTISGMAGDDTLSGGRGNDLLNGGEGADNLDGGSGNDTASYVGSAAGVKVHLESAKQSLNTGGQAQGDVLTNIENLIGSAKNDTLVGNAGVNRLRGGGGADVLEGGGGADVLDGG